MRLYGREKGCRMDVGRLNKGMTQGNSRKELGRNARKGM